MGTPIAQARVATVPPSFQQVEMLRKIRRYPECAPNYEFIYLFRIDGPVELDSLAGAVGDLIARHDALRVRIVRRGDDYVQRIEAVRDGAAVVDRISGTQADVVRRMLGRGYVADQVWSGLPLFRPYIEVADSAVYLTFIVHHLICDERSIRVLCRDFAELYAARRAGRVARLSPVPLSYAEFSQAQRADWQRIGDEAVAFFRERLTNLAGPVEWPIADPGRGPVPGTLETLPFSVPPDVLPGIEMASKAVRGSQFMVLMAASAVATARMTGCTDLLLGSDVSNREDPAKADLVGLVINTRIIRARIEPGRPFLDVVRGIREDWLDGDEFNDAHVEPVLQALGFPELLLVEMGSHEEDDYAQLKLEGLTVTPIEVRREVNYWRDVFFMWNTERDGFSCAICRNSARVSAETAAALAAQTIAVLSDPFGTI